MNTWDEFYDAPLQQSERPFTKETNDYQNQETPTVLTGEQLSDFLTRLSGKSPDGSPNSLITYKTYNFDGLEEDPDRDHIIYADNAYINITLHQSMPNIYLVDICFPSPEDLQLKHLWADLNKHLDNERRYPDNRWIFYFNVLEKQSISDINDYEACALTANILNPIMFFLTRQDPSMKTDDTNIDGHLQGGNVIRMLVPNELLTFSISDPQTINEAKREILTQMQEMGEING